MKGHPAGYFFNARKGRVLHEYQLIYITKGSGVFRSECLAEREVTGGCLLLLFPGQWHTYYPHQDTGWDEYYVGFEGPMADNLVRGNFLLKEEPVLGVGFNEELVALYARILEIAEADRNFSQQYLAGIVLHMVGMILSLSKTRTFELNEMAQKIEQAKIMMNRALPGEMDWEKLASNLNLSYSWFRKLFKDYTGYAPAKYFQELKVRRAKQMLVGTSLSVKEIAFDLGFQSTEHFFSLFKKKVGISSKTRLH